MEYSGVEWCTVDSVTYSSQWSTVESVEYSGVELS